MSDHSPNLLLPYILPSQAQKHVTHNEALSVLDAIIQCTVLNQTTATPPGAAALGDAYIIGDGATDDWVGRDRHVALWQDTGWVLLTPKQGWRVWDQSSGAMVFFDGTDWIPMAGPLQNSAGIGINATSDATNKFVVASDASLFTHSGTDHQVKVNKADTPNTASLMYQSNWVGKIEAGLCGTDDYTIKYSGDGSTWADALTVSSTTGFCGLGTPAPERMLHIAGDRPFIRLHDNSATAQTGARIKLEMNDQVGNMGWIGYSTTAPHLQIQNKNAGGDIRLISGATVTLANNGNVGVGTTLPTAMLHVAGTVLCTGLTETSDARLKTSVDAATPSGKAIDALRVVQYDWADGSGHVPYGVIAQEVADTLPEAVVRGDSAEDLGEASSHWAVRQAPLVALLIKEVQELRKRVADLEAA